MRTPALFGVCSSAAIAQDEQDEGMDFSRVEPLLSDDADVRLSTLYDLINQRTFIVEFLKREMNKPSFWQDRNFDGKVDYSLQLVSAMRLEDLDYVLVDHIDFKLDILTARLGARRSVDASLPVVNALIDIGGTEVRKSLLLRLQDDQTEEQRICCLWVLSKTYGEVLPYVLEQELKRYPVEPAQSNLKKAQIALQTLPRDYGKFATSKIEDVAEAPL